MNPPPPQGPISRSHHSGGYKFNIQILVTQSILVVEGLSSFLSTPERSTPDSFLLPAHCWVPELTCFLIVLGLGNDGTVRMTGSALSSVFSNAVWCSPCWENFTDRRCDSDTVKVHTLCRGSQQWLIVRQKGRFSALLWSPHQEIT